MFEAYPEVERDLWGGELWTRGCYVGTAGEHGDEEAISRYVKNQGRNIDGYEKIYETRHLELFAWLSR
jgi:putative transposase